MKNTTEEVNKNPKFKQILAGETIKEVTAASGDKIVKLATKGAGKFMNVMIPTKSDIRRQLFPVKIMSEDFSR